MQDIFITEMKVSFNLFGGDIWGALQYLQSSDHGKQDWDDLFGSIPMAWLPILQN